MNDQTLQGHRFAELRVVGMIAAENGGPSDEWLCHCNCGRYGTFSTRELTNPQTGALSCGRCGLVDYDISPADRELGREHPAEWKSWKRALEMGELCPAWSQSFADFLQYVGKKPEGQVLWRRDAKQVHSPTNKTQWTKKSEMHKVQYRGRLMSIGQFAAETGIPVRYVVAVRPHVKSIGEAILDAWRLTQNKQRLKAEARAAAKRQP